LEYEAVEIDWKGFRTGRNRPISLATGIGLGCDVRPPGVTHVELAGNPPKNLLAEEVDVYIPDATDPSPPSTQTLRSFDEATGAETGSQTFSF
jgi:hypothetical protein